MSVAAGSTNLAARAGPLRQPERHLPQPLPRQLRDRIRKRRRQRGHAGLAHALGRVAARHDVDGDLRRRVGDARRDELMKIALLDDAVP